MLYRIVARDNPGPARDALHTVPPWAEAPTATGVRRRYGGNEGDWIDFLRPDGTVVTTVRLSTWARLYMDGCQFIEGLEDDSAT